MIHVSWQQYLLSPPPSPEVFQGLSQVLYPLCQILLRVCVSKGWVPFMICEVRLGKQTVTSQEVRGCQGFFNVEVWPPLPLLTGLRESHCFNHKLKHAGELIAIGDVMLIYNQRQPRTLWQMGRVQESDGAVRGASLQVQMIIVLLVHIQINHCGITYVYSAMNVFK